MSLDDLVIKQHTDPLRREIDRLREVKAKLKRALRVSLAERDEWRERSGQDCDGLNCPQLAAVTEKVKELTAEETALRALWKNANLAAHELAADIAAAGAREKAMREALTGLVRKAEGLTLHSDDCGRIDSECDENAEECCQHGEGDMADHCPECECGVSDLQLTVVRARAALAATALERGET